MAGLGQSIGLPFFVAGREVGGMAKRSMERWTAHRKNTERACQT